MVERFELKDTETIDINFMFATAQELRDAERKKQRLEDTGYSLVGHTGNRMIYRKV
jgi:hypothetical protein